MHDNDNKEIILIIGPGGIVSTFAGLILGRIVSIENPNVKEVPIEQVEAELTFDFECPLKDFPAFDPPPLQCYEKPLDDIQYIEAMKHTYLMFAPMTQTVRRQGTAMRIVDNAQASGANESKTSAIDY